MPAIKPVFISIIMLTFLLPFFGAVAHAYELLDWHGYGYFFKISSALFISLWSILLCRPGWVLQKQPPPRFAIIACRAIAALAVLAAFSSLPLCICLHMFCVLGLMVLGVLLRNKSYLPRWYYRLHFALGIVIVFCCVLILSAY